MVVEGGMEGSVALSRLSLLLSPVSHLRRCGTRINGIQQHGEIAAGSMCVCVCVAGELQDSLSVESQLVNMHLSD